MRISTSNSGKIIVLLLFCLMFTLLSPVISMAETNPVRIYVNSESLSVDVDPVNIEGRILVSLRAIFEALGANVQWDGPTDTVTGTKGGTTVVLQIDNSEALVNGETVILDVPAKLISGRTMVPIRFIAESLGADVTWVSETKSVVIVESVAEYIGIINERGNSVGNIANDGFVAQQGDWIYRYSEFFGGILSREETGEANDFSWTAINAERSWFINVIGNWVYYCNLEDWNCVYKVRTDGTNMTKINSESSMDLNVIGEWIYYAQGKVNYPFYGNLYKMKTDGSNRTKINNDASECINVVGSWIYYLNVDDEHRIYKIRTDGTDRTKINDEESAFINVVDDWIYYANYSDEGRLYKIKTDGTSNTEITDDRTWCINVIDDWIYYANASDDNNLYKIKTDGTSMMKMNDDDSQYICIVGEWIYYYNSDGKALRMKTDGTQRGFTLQ